MKNFKLDADQFKPLATGLGSCIATDRITVDGLPVGFMYKDEAQSLHDSGWVFMSGDESQDYMDDPSNLAMYDINTIANYDPSIIPFLNASVSSSFKKLESGKIVKIS